MELIHSYMKYDNLKWKREAVVQGVAFGAGIVAGVVIGALLAPAAGGILLTVAIGGVAALAIDAGVQYLTGSIYDGIAHD